MYSRGKIGKDNGKEWKTRPTNQILPKRGFDDGTGQTYIVGGRAVSERKSQKFADEHVAERMGREKQTNLRRKNEAAAREKELANLMGSDNGTTGAKYLEAANKLRREDEQKDKKETAKKALEQGLGDTLKPRPFHASAIKLIGFDPTTAQNEGGLMVEKGEEGRRRVSPDRAGPNRRSASSDTCEVAPASSKPSLLYVARLDLPLDSATWQGASPSRMLASRSVDVRSRRSPPTNPLRSP